MTTAADHHRWRSARFVDVAAPMGELALVETRWTGDRADLDAARTSAGAGRTVTTIERRTPDGEVVHGIRVWDADSPAIRAYDRIDTYEFDPAWVLPGRYDPAARVVRFEVDGVEHRLSARDDGGDVLIVFTDDTTGNETYRLGRHLAVSRPEGGSGAVVLDFNRAFIPPCGFSAHFDPPHPSAGDRLPFRVPAGEKNVVFVDGFEVGTA